MKTGDVYENMCNKQMCNKKMYNKMEALHKMCENKSFH